MLVASVCVVVVLLFFFGGIEQFQFATLESRLLVLLMVCNLAAELRVPVKFQTKSSTDGDKVSALVLIWPPSDAPTSSGLEEELVFCNRPAGGDQAATVMCDINT